MDVYAGEPILALRGVTHRHAGREILRDVSLTVHRGNRLGLLGVNGAGKSTLLRILAGTEPPDEGEVTRARDLTLGVLAQELALDPDATVAQVVDQGVAHRRALVRRFEELGHRLDDAAAIAEHARLQAEIDRLEAWDLDREVARTMEALRVPAPDRKVGTLSGGEQRRVALCRVLVEHPDVLVLDEPTNHLDAATIGWLEAHLAGYRGSVVFVTHDRYFLDRVADRMVELDFGKLAEYVGNYTEYLMLKAEREAAEAQAEHVRQQSLKRELAWVRKQPRGRQTKQQARVDRYDALLVQDGPQRHGEVELLIPTGPRLGTRVVDLKGVSKAKGDRCLIRDLTLELRPGMRLGVVGPNGAGKTTLMRLILGAEAPDAGTVQAGVNTRFVYADQGRHLLDPEKPLVEEVAGDSPWVTIGDQQVTVRTYLRRFLFTDEQANTPIKRLSGGEQNRAQLAKLLRTGGNVLILDEPTNDLDLATLRVLEEALVAFPGCALVVSHDRYFLNRVATGILSFEGDGRVTYSEGSYDWWLENRGGAGFEDGDADGGTHPVTAGRSPARPEAPAASKAQGPSVARKLSWKEGQELAGMEGAIATAEAEAARLEALLQDPDLYATRGAEVQVLVDELAAAKAQVEALYSRWQELEALQAASR